MFKFVINFRPGVRSPCCHSLNMPPFQLEISDPKAFDFVTRYSFYFNMKLNQSLRDT